MVVMRRVKVLMMLTEMMRVTMMITTMMVVVMAALIITVRLMLTLITVFRISELILDHPMYRDALRRNVMTSAEGGVEGAQNAGIAEQAQEAVSEVTEESVITKGMKL